MPPTPRKNKSRDLTIQVSPGKMAKRFLADAVKNKKKSRTKRKRSSKRLGATSSSSGGFLKTKKGNRNVMDKYARLGVVAWREEAGQQDNFNPNPGLGKVPQVVYIGHTTFSQQIYQASACRALIKRLLLKADIDVTDFDTVAVFPNANYYILYVVYQPSPGSATLIDSSINYSPGLESPNDLATKLYNLIFNGSYTDNQIIWKRLRLDASDPITFNNEGTVAQINLETARIHFHCKSALKVQNRAVNSEGGDTEDVDNVPLYGRSYEGPGNGAIYVINNNQYFFQAQPLPADALGVVGNPQRFAITPNVTNFGTGYNNTMYKEPPMPKSFKTVTHCGKAHLEPGQIKTSVITHTKSFSFMRMVRDFYSGTTSPGPIGAYQRSYGKYRFFCLEKMIQTVATTTVNSIKVAFEVDTKVGAYATDHKVGYSTYLQSATTINPA